MSVHLPYDGSLLTPLTSPCLTAPCSQVETELKDKCGEILQLLDSHVIPSATTEESKVFFHKM